MHLCGRAGVKGYGEARSESREARRARRGLTLLALGGRLDVHLAVQKALAALLDGIGSTLHLQRPVRTGGQKSGRQAPSRGTRA